jgi:hypothetical protein
MQHALWVLAFAWAVAPEEKRLQRQITIDRELLVKAKEEKEQIHKEIGDTKLQESNLTDQLKIVQHEDAEVEELVHQEEENDKVALAASVASAKANISAMTTEQEKTKKALEDEENKVGETKAEIESLHEKVLKEQRAFLAAHAQTNQADAILEKTAAGSAMVQMNRRGPDISPVMDKAPEPKGVPEQGFEGEAVAHADMKTITEDWGSEYGPDLHAHHALKHSFGVTVALVAVAALYA